MNYLSVCAIYRDEAPNLREWIEFHRLVGVERFFLYNNNSQDGHREALAPYVDEGTVVLEDWPLYPAQIQAYDDCLKRRREESRWIAFIDLDEFLFSATGRPVSDLLVEFEQSPGVVVNWVMFGSAGHRTRPPGLVIENYLRRTTEPLMNSIIKSIVDPRRVRAFCRPHFFMYRDGVAVDENHQPVANGQMWRTGSPSFERLRINHYGIKSAEEYRAKLERGHADGLRPKSPMKTERLLRLYSDVEDRAILRYLPELRSALERRA
ncbi:MAG: glycosyltransferase family 92 protein [Solirubrobacterales bacterium]